MAWTGNTMCVSFVKELMKAQHDFTPGTGHTFKLALYDSSATLTYETTDYTTDNEISGTGYAAGGITLSTVEPASSGQNAYTDFADAAWAAATFSARGGLIYNTTTGGGAGTTNAVAVLDFGADKSADNETFEVEFPTGDMLNAIIRIEVK